MQPENLRPAPGRRFLGQEESNDQRRDVSLRPSIYRKLRQQERKTLNDATRRAASPYATETVWDGGGSGTGLCGEGQALTVGYEGGWAPEHLLLLAAEASFMDSFLAAARDANLDVLGYVSSGRLDAEDRSAMPQITLRPCVVVGSAEDARRATLISAAAMQQSVVGRLLGDHLRIGLDVQLEMSSSQQPLWRASKN